ncbi:MAG: hypothetical protein M3067_02320 [Chloroflexota bacterium]|nr:hypothetical protein [Chloroflexota bacterium]
MSDPQPASPPVRPVGYRGAPLDAERGPGLGCFRFQLMVLVVLVIVTPLSVAWRAPDWLSAALLFAVIALLLVAGQTIIFLLRLVAADRRAAGRRRPVAGRSPTVGELEDRAAELGPKGEAGGPEAPSDEGPVRQ